MIISFPQFFARILNSYHIIMKNKIAFVIATKDRPDDLFRVLESLSLQYRKPDQVIIVSSGQRPPKEIWDRHSLLSITAVHTGLPSAARQRNIGVKKADISMDLIGFLDDDVVLEKNALEEMMSFWKDAGETVGGVSFNQINHPRIFASFLKDLPLTEKIGLYSREKGRVLVSGFQTLFEHVEKSFYSDWLPSTAVVWRREIFKEHWFDEWFGGYSYLEDLDFSYRVGKKYRLAVAAEARYHHFPSVRQRVNDYLFGKKEVENRMHFVRKNQEFSLFRCYGALFIRMFLTLFHFIKEHKLGYIQRLAGNFIGLAKSFL